MTTAEEDEPVDTTQLRHRESVLVEAGIFETEDTGRTVSGVVSEPVSVEVIDNETKENIQEVEQEVAPTKVGEGESSKDAVPTASATSSDIEKALPPPDPPADSVSIGSTAIPPAPRAVRQVSTPGAVMVSRRNNDQGPSTDATAGRRLAADDEHLVQAELIPENGNVEYAVASKPEKEGRAGYVGAGLLLIVVIILAVVIALRGRDIDGSVGEAGISYTESLYLGPSIIGTAAFDGFGDPVAISDDGTIVAIGAKGNGDVGDDSGMVRVYTQFDHTTEESIVDSSDTPPEGVVWRQLGNAVFGENAGDQFAHSGIAMSGSGKRIAVGATYYNATAPNSTDLLVNAGNVRVFELVGGIRWEQVGSSMNGRASGDLFGRAVAMSRDGKVIAGSSYNSNENGNYSGNVMIFRENKESNADGTVEWEPMGQVLLGRDDYDRFGRSISFSDDGMRLAIGATEYKGSDCFGFGPGFVQVYEFDGTTWNQLGKDMVGNDDQDIFGRDVTISGNGAIVAAGANLADGVASGTGMARVFEYNNESDTWVQLGQTLEGIGENDNLGVSVGLTYDGFRLVVGARQKKVGYGYVKVYDYDHEGTQTWVQSGQDLIGEEFAAKFGADLQISANGTTLVVGTPDSNANGEESGKVQVFNLTKLD